MNDTDREENSNPGKDSICRGESLKVDIRTEILHEKNSDIHQPNTLAKRLRKRIEDFYCRGDPFCEFIITTLGLAERGWDLLPESGEDGLGGIAGLKGGKERMRS